MKPLFNPQFEQWTEEERERYVWLRTIEWSNYPAFIAVALGVLLLLVLSPLQVILVVFIADFIWFLFSRFWYSYFLSSVGVYVHKLKWVVPPAVCIYFILVQRYTLAVLALLFPIIFMFGGALAAIAQGVFPRLNPTEPTGKNIEAGAFKRKRRKKSATKS